MSSGELQTVVVTTEPAPAVLGGTVNAVVTITGEPDRKVRGAKAQLVRTAIHRVTQTNVLGKGSYDSLLPCTPPNYAAYSAPASPTTAMAGTRSWHDPLAGRDEVTSSRPGEGRRVLSPVRATGEVAWMGTAR